MLELLLKSSAEVKLLPVVLFNDRLHLREIARRATLSPPETKRELDNLVNLGVLSKTKEGNLVVFSKTKSPLIKPLKDLYLYTEGVTQQLASTLSTLAINYAFIYGSFARSQDFNDIDLFITADIDEIALSKAIKKVQDKLGWEINYILWSKKDLERKIKEKNNFLENIIKNKKIWLSGDENEFVRFVERGVNKKG